MLGVLEKKDPAPGRVLAYNTTKNWAQNACGDEDCRHDAHVLRVFADWHQARSDCEDHGVNARCANSLKGSKDNTEGY